MLHISKKYYHDQRNARKEMSVTVTQSKTMLFLGVMNYGLICKITIWMDLFLTHRKWFFLLENTAIPSWNFLRLIVVWIFTCLLHRHIFKNYFLLIVNIITFPFISMVEICSPVGKCGSGKWLTFSNKIYNFRNVKLNIL